MIRTMQGDELPIVVVGAGIAGLATALHLAPMPVKLVTAGTLGGDCSTALAQGGIAAAIGPHDTPAQHAADTLAAAAGLADGDFALSIARAGETAIDWLVRRGARFDRDAAGAFALGLEAAHTHPRIVHAGGDRTGREVLRALVEAVRATPSIEVIEQATVEALTKDDGGAVNGLILRRVAERTNLRACAVVMCTGGIGGLYAHTTNPLTNLGAGLALGASAGAVLRDLEFVQFHPTAIDIGRDPMPLATEALRGEGARLVDRRGEDVMAGVPGGSLAPRDVVAATLFARIARGQQVFLELTPQLLRELPRRFPAIAAIRVEAGFDPGARLIPVRPAAHYHMGGLEVDGRGRTSVEGLWACGEVASTGLHGANRLASNSLLEALAGANLIAADLKGARLERHSSLSTRHGSYGRRHDQTGLPLLQLRLLMERHAGVVRDEAGLSTLVQMLAPFVTERALHETGGAVITALLIAVAALLRQESRGAHRRADWPATDRVPRSGRLTLAEARSIALEFVGDTAPSVKAASR